MEKSLVSKKPLKNISGKIDCGLTEDARSELRKCKVKDNATEEERDAIVVKAEDYFKKCIDDNSLSFNDKTSKEHTEQDYYDFIENGYFKYGSYSVLLNWPEILN